MSIYKGTQLIAGGSNGGSSTGSVNLVAGSNITIEEESGESGEVETVISAPNAYTKTNLVAGDNVTITQVVKPEIDANTKALCHFNDSTYEEISGTNLSLTNPTGNGIAYVTGKFSKGIQLTTGGSNDPKLYIGERYNAGTASFTFDWWVKPQNSSSGSISYRFRISNTDEWIIFNKPSSNNGITIGANIAGANDVNVPWPVEITWGDWFHVAYVNDEANTKVYLFINGKKAYEGTRTVGTSYNIGFMLYQSQWEDKIAIDEARVSDIARWTSDFTPFSMPYSEVAGDTVYQINSMAVAPVTKSFTPSAGGTTIATGLTLADYDTILVFKNGMLLKQDDTNTQDYSISTNSIVFHTAFDASDSITLTCLGKISSASATAANNAMPSSVYTNIANEGNTSTFSGTHVAPAAGYYVLRAVATASYGSVKLAYDSIDNGIISASDHANTSPELITATLPVKAGQTVAWKCSYAGFTSMSPVQATNLGLTFVYAEGTKHLKVS